MYLQCVFRLSITETSTTSAIVVTTTPLPPPVYPVRPAISPKSAELSVIADEPCNYPYRYLPRGSPTTFTCHLNGFTFDNSTTVTFRKSTVDVYTVSSGVAGVTKDPSAGGEQVTATISDDKKSVSVNVDAMTASNIPGGWLCELSRVINVAGGREVIVSQPAKDLVVYCRNGKSVGILFYVNLNTSYFYFTLSNQTLCKCTGFSLTDFLIT